MRSSVRHQASYTTSYTTSCASSLLTQVEAAAIELLGAAESRMLLMCLPPRGDASQPLTLASLTELERVLFLLTHLAKYTGTWHLLLPGSLPKFRWVWRMVCTATGLLPPCQALAHDGHFQHGRTTVAAAAPAGCCRMAVTSFIAFAASNGSSSKPVTLECPPQTPDEVRMAAQAAGLPKTEGWFRVCFLGASDPGGVVIRAAAPAPATPAARLGAPLLSAPPATPGAGQATPPQATPTTATEYSARMAESMYACVLHALVFLRASAPQVRGWALAVPSNEGWTCTATFLAAYHSAQFLWHDHVLSFPQQQLHQVTPRTRRGLKPRGGHPSCPVLQPSLLIETDATKHMMSNLLHAVPLCPCAR